VPPVRGRLRRNAGAGPVRGDRVDAPVTPDDGSGPPEPPAPTFAEAVAEELAASTPGHMPMLDHTLSPERPPGEEDDRPPRIEGLKVHFDPWQLHRHGAAPGARIRARRGRIDISIRSGEVLALVGESAREDDDGRVIVEAHTPDGGSVVFDGQDVSTVGVRRLRLPPPRPDHLPGPV
jgi:ABC-type glutathione transport system ATPase component